MTLTPTEGQHDMIGDHYHVERELGRGGMATVYLCTDIRTGEHAAVKVLRAEIASVVSRERFFREIEFESELDHPRIPKVKDAGEAAGIPFYAMEYVEGESLRARLQRERRLPVSEVARIAREIAKPMSYAHARGIIHRDVKPENVLLRGEDVFVLDFGVARAIIGSAGDRLTRTGITVGTPAYMSPEQVTADKTLDYRSDIYSFGCVVYEMIAGTPPFKGATPQVLMTNRFTSPPASLRSLQRDVPESVELAVAKAMSRSPAQRWDSAEEFAAALDPEGAGSSVDEARDLVTGLERDHRAQESHEAGDAPAPTRVEALRVEEPGFHTAAAPQRAGRKWMIVTAGAFVLAIAAGLWMSYR